MAATATSYQLTVLMCGPSEDSRGGISSVIRGYRSVGYPPEIRVRHVATSASGSRIKKFQVGLHGMLVALVAMSTTDVVHLHVSSGSSFLRKTVILLVAKVARVPVVFHVHGSDFDRFASGRLRPVVRAALTGAYAVVALSPQWRQTLLTVAPGANVVVIHNGIMIPPKPTNVEHGPLVSLGKLGRRKGTFDILKAVSTINDPTISVLLAGDGEIDQVRSEAVRLNISDQVEVLGWLDPAQCQQLLLRACAFLLPSYAEGLPMALLEAMAHGLPVIATPVGGMPEVVRDGDTGLVVGCGEVDDLASAIKNLMDDAHQRTEMGHRGRKLICDCFSIDKTMKELAVLWCAAKGSKYHRPDEPMHVATH